MRLHIWTLASADKVQIWPWHGGASKHDIEQGSGVCVLYSTQPPGSIYYIAIGGGGGSWCYIVDGPGDHLLRGPPTIGHLRTKSDKFPRRNFDIFRCVRTFAGGVVDVASALA